ncbi:MAG: electron transfer flavoprotein subunit alpha/FixB family protein [Parvularculaceae bacterium]|nr:electron transfer flavoprotein subunit alpha/FixB family protein [Parvularculaceae bacterium]
MAVLLVADHNAAALSDSVSKALTAALLISPEVDILVAGSGAGAVATEASKLKGVRKVLHADDAAYAKLLAEPVSALVLSLAAGYGAIVAPATANGKNILPRVAALLDVMQISDVIGVEAPDTFVRPIYAGNAVQTVKSKDPKIVATIRGASFKAADTAEAGGAASIEKIAAAAKPGVSEFVREEIARSDRPELTAAKIVVSGGRALGSHENFEKLIYPLADKLGAAVGASRAAVDAGYMPNDHQVGQTGKVVAPALYIAVGISGAIQHLAGMKDSKVIVAINKDEEAPIFQIADYGLVGDLFKILPELKDAL